MQLLDGKKTAKKILDSLKIDIAQLASTGKKAPHLAAIFVGNNPASQSYVSSKVKACNEIGIMSTLIEFEEDITEIKLLEQIEELNDDISVDGILVQLPLPPHISERNVIEAISPAKDVDGFHPVNIGRMVLSEEECFLPATPYGIILLLKHNKIPTKGKHAVVIGRSHIVGRPISILLSENRDPGNCTVTVCHSKTENLKEICLQADIIITALGVPGFLKADMVKENATIIDVGISRIEDASRKSGYRIVGDVDFNEVAPKCSFITPVPGGVGPMTIAALMKNTYKACINRN
jgi:methylenetetrahydrofolate dehydrogenase (NADP+) / methenyltetrahydrofolate cyclohydrolase